MAFQLGDDQKFDLAVQGVDDAGNVVPATFAAPPTWAVSDNTIATVAPSADGTSCTVTATGKLGSASVHVTGQGGAGVAPLDATFDFDVVVTAEIGFTLSPSAPAHK